MLPRVESQGLSSDLKEVMLQSDQILSRIAKRSSGSRRDLALGAYRLCMRRVDCRSERQVRARLLDNFQVLGLLGLSADSKSPFMHLECCLVISLNYNK
jgi:hypothetical protein